ncbi:MAG: hypothetical protein IJ563_09515 [Selenomonadaceae bacterium]|nr:hypothetical protein [Selenomonadaceae bacterium]
MDDEIRWKVTDPLGNEIVLYEKNFADHIKGDHSSKDAEARASIEEQAKFSIQSPRFIIKNAIKGRRKYLDLVDVPQDSIKKYRTLTIVVDFNVRPCEVITWFARRSMNFEGTDEELIYDVRIQNHERRPL